MAIHTAEQKIAPVVDAPTSSSFWRISKRWLGRDWAVAFLFVAPTVILLFGLIGYPLLDAVWMSFHNVTGVTNRGWVGLNNYERLWSDAQFRDSVWNTIQFAGFSVFIKFWLGLGAACLLNRAGLRFSSVLTGLVLLPWIIPEVVAALTWRGLYDPIFGGLNVLLIQLGIIDTGIVWLGDYDLALPSVIAVNVWKGIPFFTIIFLAGLKAIDKELYDAASVDGASGWNKFRDITLARPSIRDCRGLPALVDLDVERIRPCLPDDRRWPRRRNAPLLDPVVRIRTRPNALQHGCRGRDGDRASVACHHRGSWKVHAGRQRSTQ